jgi:hypothetical protein
MQVLRSCAFSVPALPSASETFACSHLNTDKHQNKISEPDLIKHNISIQIWDEQGHACCPQFKDLPPLCNYSFVKKIGMQPSWRMGFTRDWSVKLRLQLYYVYLRFGEDAAWERRTNTCRHNFWLWKERKTASESILGGTHRTVDWVMRAVLLMVRGH